MEELLILKASAYRPRPRGRKTTPWKSCVHLMAGVKASTYDHQLGEEGYIMEELRASDGY